MTSFIVLLNVIFVQAQVTTTFACSGTSGSFRSGSVNSSGTKNDGELINISSNTNRGWASFDISSIPEGSIITAATVEFSTYASVVSSANNFCYGFLGNPSTMTGTNLYTTCASGVILNTSSWTGSFSATTNYLNSKTINSAGLNFINSNLGGIINVGFVRGAASAYYIHGYLNAAAPTLTITYTLPTACSGSPIAGITSGPNSICGSTSFNLSLTGVAQGISQLSYQWQRADDSLFTSNLENLGTASTLSTTQMSSKYYRCMVTCTNSGLSSYSTPLLVTTTPFIDCYCTSSANSSDDEEITNVTFGFMSNSSSCGTIAPGPGSVASKYSNYKSGLGAPFPPFIYIGENNSFSFTQTSCGSAYSNRFYCWIDFNHDGDFDDADENVYTGNSYYGNHTDVGYISIPNTAMIGLTAMRVMNVEGSVSSPCQNFDYGEVEDYLVQLLWSEVCIFGTPSLGATIGPSSACANSNFTLSYQNTVPIGNPNLSLQWQSADDISFTTNVNTVGTNQTLTTSQTSSKYYRCKLTCNSSNSSSYSTPLYISLNTNPCSCIQYCTPTTPTGCVSYLTNVSFAGLNNNSGCGYPYQNFTNIGGGSVTAGNTYTLNYNYSPYYSGMETVAYFDWNHDGDFDDGNEMYTTTIDMMTGTRDIQVPCDALAGPTRMRVRIALEPTAWSACGSLDWSEAEDYCINVTPGSCNAILNAKCFLQGYYIGNGMMNSVLTNQGLTHPITDCDEIQVELHNTISPYSLAYSFTGTLHTDGTIACTFPLASIGNNYYIVVKHRNSIETWSSNPITISANSNYDFTISSNQSFGNNVKNVESNVYVIYSGDINQDENIDLIDASILELDISNFETGYFGTDINGDGNVDLLDSPILENNLSNFVFSIHP